MIAHRCDFYKCQDNCTIKDNLIDGYYPLQLEMDDLNLHPGDFKPVLTDPIERSIIKWDTDYEFEDESNQTMFDSIRYVFLVSSRYFQFLKPNCKGGEPLQLP